MTQASGMIASRDGGKVQIEEYGDHAGVPALGGLV